MQGQLEEGGYRRVRHRWLVQVAVGIGAFTTTGDIAGVNVALHTISRHFNVDAATAAWLPLLVFLTITSTLLLFGRLSDLFGSKRVFIAGFVVYAASSLAASLAPSFPLLLAARGVQALGVSMLSSNSAAILTECYPQHERGRAMGVSSTLVGLAFFVGPIIAGFVIKALGWQYVFLTGVPTSVLGIVVSAVVLPRSLPAAGRRFDFPGAFLFAVAAISLLLAVNSARTSALTSPGVFGFAVVAAVALVAFIVVEKRVPEPMLEMGLFRIRLFSFSLLAAFALFLGTTGQDLLIPLFIQQVMLLDPAVAGLAVSVVPFIRMVLSSPSGILSDRFGSRWLVAFGAALVGVGILGLNRMDASTTMPYLLGCLAVIGLGTGFFFPPNMHAIMVSLPPDRLGTASGALGMRRNLGQSLSIAVTAYLLQVGSGGADAAVSGYQLAFTVQSACLFASALAAVAAGSTLTARQRALASRATG